MKPMRISFFLFILTVLLTTSYSCVQRKKTVVAPSSEYGAQWKVALKQEYRNKGRLVIHWADTITEAHNVVFGADSVTGDQTPSIYTYDYMNFRSYGKNRFFPECKRHAMNGVHYYTYESYRPGSFALAYSNILEYRMVESAHGESALFNAGITLAGIGIFLAIACNCPEVSSTSVDGEKIFHGTTLTGAFSPSLERSEYLVLDGFEPVDGKIDIQFANELAETDYINRLQLLKFTKDHGDGIAYGTDHTLYTYNKTQKPTNAYDHSYGDHHGAISKSDASNFSFDNLEDPEKLNSLTVGFNLGESQKQPAVVIEARQTEWLFKMTHLFLNSAGRKTDVLMDRMAKGDEKTYKEKAAQRGVSLNVLMETNNGWTSIGTIHNVGSSKQKEYILPIDQALLPKNTKQIRLQFESAYNFWEINTVSLTYDWKKVTKIEPIPLRQAIRHDGENVLNQLIANDQDYMILDGPGTGIQLLAQDEQGEKDVYVLESTGYYTVHTKNEGAPNRKLLYLVKKPQGTQRLSVYAHQFEE